MNWVAVMLAGSFAIFVARENWCWAWQLLNGAILGIVGWKADNPGKKWCGII
jgi:hypothetical protein